MVNPDEFKKQVRELINQDEKIEFLGDFDDIVSLLTETHAKKLLDWIMRIIQKSEQPITGGSNKPYKDWKKSDLLVFLHRFKINNNEYRALLVKIKNSLYIEFHIGNHKYYDNVMDDLV